MMRAEINTPARLGTYRLEQLLGRGGMGEVFLAWDERLERHVAVKRILSDPPPDQRARTRFRREARAVARLNHPAIVQIYDLLEEGGDDCLVMEYVNGRGLVEMIGEGPLEVSEALRIAAEIADGLAEAHSKGLVHRDLKPENVRIAETGRVKILDFGLARLLWDDRSEREAVTQSGALVGTLHAMSPEQASGRDVDHRSDLFALGSLLYEMLTGRSPFRGRNVLDTLRRVTSEEPPPLAELRGELSPELIELVERLLAKDPKQRPQNARLVAGAMERLRKQPRISDAGAQPQSSTEGTGGGEALVADLTDLPTGEWPGLAATAAEGAVETVIRTLLISELLGRSKLRQAFGETRGAEILAKHDRAARDLLARHGGYEVDKSETFLLLFERPLAAVAFALAFHRRLAELATSLAGDLEVELEADLEARIAIHLGEVRLRRNAPEDISRGAKLLEIEGLARPAVARLVNLAAPGQTLLTSGAFDLARHAARDDECWDDSLRWLAHGGYLIAGAEEPVEVFEVGVQDRAPLLPPIDSDNARRVVALSEEIVLGWRPAPGQVVPRRPNWHLEERLGEGGFGEVWLASHESGEKRVFKFCFDASRLRALKREVTLFRVLKEALGQRDDIARVLDWDFDSAPFFLEVEHTEGGDLTAWAEQQGGLLAIPMPTRIELVAQVAEALAAAHSVGVLHKDIKPENILITNDTQGRPRVRLTDFGIGALLDRSQLEAQGLPALGFTETMSDASETGGSRRYMAPELLEGRSASVPADLYSLGVTLYQLVLADFARTVAPGWQRDVSDELLSEDIAALVDGDPSRRPISASVVAEGLRSLEQRRAARSAGHRARRRRRQWRFAAAIGLLVTLVASIMALQATRARHRAQALQARAVEARGDAEELVAFMLGDLQKELRKIGRLDALDGAGEKALAYFDGLSADEQNPTSLARHAQALHQIGDVRMAQDRLEDALVLFQRAAAKSEELVLASTEDPQALFELGQSRFWVGNVYYRQRGYPAALEQMETYLELSQRLHEGHPENDDWLLEVAYAHNNVGGILIRLDNQPLAAEHFRKSLEISHQLFERDSSQPARRSRLINAHLRLGEIQRDANKLEAAYQSALGALELARDIPPGAPANALRQLTSVHDSLAVYALALGDLDETLRFRRAQVEQLEQLLAIDPEHGEWKDLLGFAAMNLGKTLAFIGKSGEASIELRRAIEIAESRLAAAPGAPRATFAVSTALTAKAEFDFERDKVADALTGASRALDLSAAHAEHRTVHFDASLILGQAQERLGLGQDARRQWQQARSIAEPLSEGRQGFRWLDRWVRILLVLDEIDHARAPIHALLGMGYGHPRFLTACRAQAPDLCPSASPSVSSNADI